MIKRYLKLVLIAGFTLIGVAVAVRLTSHDTPEAAKLVNLDGVLHTSALAVSASTTAPQKPKANSDYLRIAPTSEGYAPVMEAAHENPNSRFKNPAKPVCPVFPKNFAAPVRVTSGVANVACTPVYARPDCAGSVAYDGSLVYADAFPGCDVSYRCTQFKTEEFITVKDAASQQSWSWELDCGELTPRLTPANTIELVDKGGVPRLRINAPEGKDAAGKLLRVGERLALKRDGNRITLTAELNGCKFPVVIDPSWSSTGTMAFSRNIHTATLLNSGKVLVVGGTDANTNLSLSSCEQFDPSSGTWTTTASMNSNRSYHNAILLNTNEVLVVCGADDSGTITTCELYDPNQDKWTITAPLASRPSYHASVLLKDGTVLTTGGVASGNNVLNSCALYDRTTQAWTTTGSFSQARYGHAVTMLNDGRILATGGYDGGVQYSCEIYDPILKSWNVTGSLHSSRVFHSAILLNDGNVIIVQTYDQSAQCENFDPIAGIWTQTEAISAFNVGTATLLQNGKILVAGGYSGGGSKICNVFDITANVFAATPSLIISRAQPTATLLSSGKVLVVGGVVNGPVSLVAEVYDPAPVAMSQIISIHSGAQMAVTLNADAINDPLFYMVVVQPNHGTLVGIGNNLTYISISGYIGSDSFTFKVNDSIADSNIATITINVTDAAPDLPHV